jgi:hypothetical protein
VPRRTMGTARVAPRTVNDGIRVKWLDERAPARSPSVLYGRMIAAPWEDCVAQRLAYEAGGQRLETLLERVRERLGDPAAHLWWTGQGNLTLSADQVETLLDYEPGTEARS